MSPEPFFKQQTTTSEYILISSHFAHCKMFITLHKQSSMRRLCNWKYLTTVWLSDVVITMLPAGRCAGGALVRPTRASCARDPCTVNSGPASGLALGRSVSHCHSYQGSANSAGYIALHSAHWVSRCFWYLLRYLCSYLIKHTYKKSCGGTCEGKMKNILSRKSLEKTN